MAVFSFFVILAPYLIGSVPFGLILTKLAGLGDIRAIGSGNIGATNVLRTGNKKLALLTLLLDGGKGWLAVWLTHDILLTRMLENMAKLAQLPASENAMDSPIVYAMLIESVTMLAAPLLAILGHMYPVWLKFKGGKGVATAIGAFLAMNVWLGAGVIAIWLSVFTVTRISSLSALAAMALAPIITFVLKQEGAPMQGGATIVILIISGLIFWKHKDNIKRLVKGDEPRFGRK